MTLPFYRYAMNTNLKSHAIKFVLLVALWQAIHIIFFGIFTTYNKEIASNELGVSEYYPMFQDIHVMMFVGFGFLLVFPSQFSLSAVSLNLLLGALVFQWSILTNGFWDQVHTGSFKIIEISIEKYVA